MPYSQRLSRSEVTELLNNPQIKVIFNRVGTFKYLRQPNSGTLTRQGFTVVTGSKNQKKAVLRNKVRRQLYTLFRLYTKENKDITTIVGMLYVSKQIYDMSYKDLNHYLYELLQKTLV